MISKCLCIYFVLSLWRTTVRPFGLFMLVKPCWMVIMDRCVPCCTPCSRGACTQINGEADIQECRRKDLFFKPKEHTIYFFKTPPKLCVCAGWRSRFLNFILVRWFRPSLIAFWHTSLSFKRTGIAQVSVNSDCERHEEISLENTADFKGYLSVCIYTAMSQTNLTSNQSCNIITLPFSLCISFANLPDIDSTTIIIHLQYLCCLF